MKRKILVGVVCLFAVMRMGVADATAASQKAKKAQKSEKPAPETPLTAEGEKLITKYSEMLKTLQAEIDKALPLIDEQEKAAYLKTRDVEKAAEANRNAKQADLDKNRSGAGLLSHHKAWLDRATKGVAEAKEKLKQAEAMEGDKEAKAKAVKEAQEALANIQKNYDMAVDATKGAQDAVDKAKLVEPKLIEVLEAAEKALVLAQANTMKAVKELNLGDFLASDKLDVKLAKCVILKDATPRGLAEYAEQGKDLETLLDKLLADDVLMLQMAVADGANGDKYAKAMEIYTAIQKASDKAKDGVLQKLALAVALEHAVPVKQSNPAAKPDAPTTVDPLKRYLHFEKAYLAGELDPRFKDLSVWDYRMVVNGDEPDEIIGWGREMLRNYRPDEISTPDYRWRYVQAVKTEVKYGSGDQKNDRPELQNYQNIIMNGGVCGRRAFFGRFILRCFGIPTVARPQVGHATLAHWTPDGWVVNLGANWGCGSKGIGKYDTDLDFLAMTQARKVEKTCLRVHRARWVGDVLGEKKAFGFKSASGFWNELALLIQRQIIEEAKAVALAAVGTDIGEANESKEKDVVQKVVLSDEDKAIVTDKNGIITIPAVACSTSTNSPGKILFMESKLGGKQMHYNRSGDPLNFEYTLMAPEAGKYALTARVVTTSAEQHLLVTANDAVEQADIAVPFTTGMWDKTPPVEVSLVKGKNVLRFSRGGQNIKGLTIKDLTLKPVK